MIQNKYVVVLPWLLLACYLVVSSGCIKRVKDNSSISIAADSLSAVDQVDSLVITMIGATSKTVLDVLRDSHQVNIKSSAMGVFVLAIDSIKNSSNAYWLYSVNGNMGQVACDRFLTRPNDTIRWYYRIIAQ